jgi:hypothetical protein
MLSRSQPKRAPEKRKILKRNELTEPLEALQRDFQRGRLTLYLGAGVSRDSGLPSWSTLIASLYYAAVDADWSPRWLAYPNYLYALGEWLLKKSGEPPEVIAGRIDTYFEQRSEFAKKLEEALYLPWRQTYRSGQTPPPAKLRSGNLLLKAVAELCEATNARRGVHAVVTTNYDSLLEEVLRTGAASQRFVPIWEQADKLGAGKKGIFHVHGYLPARGQGSRYEQIMLTEAQYHGAASDPYSWSNLTLIQCFSATTGLVIGMSMTDRNLRRLLHALHQTQLRERQYVILKEPEVPAMSTCDQQEVHERAVTYSERFAGSGLKKGNQMGEDMQQILAELIRQEKTMAEKSFASIGVTPLWVKDYDEIPVLVEAVRKP